MAYFCCFSLDGNLDFLYFLQKKVWQQTFLTLAKLTDKTAEAAAKFGRRLSSNNNNNNSNNNNRMIRQKSFDTSLRDAKAGKFQCDQIG